VFRIHAPLDPDIVATAALIADPSRAHMLEALADGSARPAGELACIAGVSPQTASSHLNKLSDGRLVLREVQGRHRYYRLEPRIAELLEGLASCAPASRALTPSQARRGDTLRFARTCYGHLAGKLGVAITDALCARGILVSSDVEYGVTAAGTDWFGGLGIDVGSLRRRPRSRRCLDWSERRHHLAGALGVALGSRLFELGWIRRVAASRAVRLTDCGRAELCTALDLDLEL
jgi:DNA-binding transcriptional ArsR family regulator